MGHGLLEFDILHIRAVAAEIKEIDEVVLFGSRAKGTHDKGSDVDLAIKGRDVNDDTVFQLSDQLNEERPLPYFFDVLDYNSLEKDEPIRAHIDRVGVAIFTASDKKGGLRSIAILTH